jgi:hypothetical protein
MYRPTQGNATGSIYYLSNEFLSTTDTSEIQFPPSHGTSGTYHRTHVFCQVMVNYFQHGKGIPQPYRKSKNLQVAVPILRTNF